MDRRRRRLGLRHRRRVARPCPRPEPRRQRLSARYRGLFQPRQSILQGDPPSRFGQICSGRQANAAQGSGTAGHSLWLCLRRAGCTGWQPRAHDPSAARRRGLVPRRSQGVGGRALRHRRQDRSARGSGARAVAPQGGGRRDHCAHARPDRGSAGAGAAVLAGQGVRRSAAARPECSGAGRNTPIQCNP